MGSMIGGLIQAGSLQKDAEFQRTAAGVNRDLYGLAATSALETGNQQAAQATLKGNQVAAAQKVGYAASGVDTQSGTPMEAMADTRVMSAMDAATLRNNAAREAWGYKVKGLQAFKQGNLQAEKDDNQAVGDAVGGWAKDFTTLLGAGG
jgi:hypothetical protein